jgi:hypothetical protein
MQPRPPDMDATFHAGTGQAVPAGAVGGRDQESDCRGALRAPGGTSKNHIGNQQRGNPIGFRITIEKDTGDPHPLPLFLIGVCKTSISRISFAC